MTRQLRLIVAYSVIDAGHPFVRAAYHLEGDGPLILQAYEKIATVRAAIKSAHYPNVVAVAQQIAQGDVNLQQYLQAHASDCICPGLQYFTEKLGSDVSLPFFAFKAACLFSPIKVHEMQPVASEVDTRSVFPFLSDVPR